MESGGGGGGSGGGTRRGQAGSGEPGPERPREGQELAQGHTASPGRSWPRPLCLEGPRCSPLRAQLGGRGVADGPLPPQTSRTWAQSGLRRHRPTCHRHRSTEAGSGVPTPAEPAPPRTHPRRPAGERGHIFSTWGGSLEGAVLVAYLKEASPPTHTQSFLPSVCGFRFLGARGTGCGLT